MHMGGLNGPVYALFVFGQLIKIPFHGGGQGLDHILQRVLVSPAVKIKEERGDFRICEKLGIEILLAQILCHGVVVGKIAVVHQGFVESHKGMSPSRMPDFSLGGVSLVGDPYMGLEIVQLIILHDLLSISYNFEDKEIPAVAQHKSMLFPISVIIGFVNVETVLVDEFILNPPCGHFFQTILVYKMTQHFRFHPYKIPEHFGWFHIQPPNIPVIRHMGDPLRKMHVEKSIDKARFKIRNHIFIEYGNLKDIVFFKDLI